MLRLADSLCSGRRRCNISLPNESFDRLNPCLSELKLYLTAGYRCLQGIDTLLGLRNGNVTKCIMLGRYYGIREAFEKCWAHSPLRAAARPNFTLPFTGVATVARRLRIDVHDNDNNDNDNA